MKKKILAVAVSAAFSTALIAALVEGVPEHDFGLDELLVPERDVIAPDKWHADNGHPERPEPGEPMGYDEGALRISTQSTVVTSVPAAALAQYMIAKRDGD